MNHPTLCLLSLLLIAAAPAEELTAFVRLESAGSTHRHEVAVHLDLEPTRRAYTKSAALRARLVRKVQKLRGRTKSFTVLNADAIERLRHADWRQVRVEGDFDRTTGTATVRTVLSLRNVTLTGIIVQDVPYTQHGELRKSTGLAVSGKTIAIPGLHHFGRTEDVLGQTVTVRGVFYELDNYLDSEAFRAASAEDVRLTRLATEYGGGVEGSPMIDTDHVLEAGTQVWVTAAHPFHQGLYVEVLDGQDSIGLAPTGIMQPKVDPAAPTTIKEGTTPGATQGLGTSLRQAK